MSSNEDIASGRLSTWSLCREKSPQMRTRTNRVRTKTIFLKKCI